MVKQLYLPESGTREIGGLGRQPGNWEIGGLGSLAPVPSSSSRHTDNGIARGSRVSL